jgi:hypothetical protein
LAISGRKDSSKPKNVAVSIRRRCQFADLFRTTGRGKMTSLKKSAIESGKLSRQVRSAGLISLYSKQESEEIFKRTKNRKPRPSCTNVGRRGTTKLNFEVKTTSKRKDRNMH